MYILGSVPDTQKNMEGAGAVEVHEAIPSFTIPNVYHVTRSSNRLSLWIVSEIKFRDEYFFRITTNDMGALCSGLSYHETVAIRDVHRHKGH